MILVGVCQVLLSQWLIVAKIDLAAQLSGNFFWGLDNIRSGTKIYVRSSNRLHNLLLIGDD